MEKYADYAWRFWDSLGKIRLTCRSEGVNSVRKEIQYFIHTRFAIEDYKQGTTID